MLDQQGMAHGPRILTLRQVRAVCTQREPTRQQREERREREREKERRKNDEREKEEGTRERGRESAKPRHTYTTLTLDTTNTTLDTTHTHTHKRGATHRFAILGPPLLCGWSSRSRPLCVCIFACLCWHLIRLQPCTKGFPDGRHEIDIFVPSTGNFNVVSLDHMKKLSGTAMAGNNGFLHVARSTTHASSVSVCLLATVCFSSWSAPPVFFSL